MTAALSTIQKVMLTHESAQSPVEHSHVRAAQATALRVCHKAAGHNYNEAQASLATDPLSFKLCSTAECFAVGSEGGSHSRGREGQEGWAAAAGPGPPDWQGH